METDTNVAIGTVHALLLDIQSKISGLQAQEASLSIVLESLQGTLKIQLTELESAKDIIDTKDDVIAAKQAVIDVVPEAKALDIANDAKE